MDHSKIKFDSISKSFEFEKLSRDIDSICDINELRNIAKSYVKLYFYQQEVITKIGNI